MNRPDLYATLHRAGYRFSWRDRFEMVVDYLADTKFFVGVTVGSFATVGAAFVWALAAGGAL